jgi:teichuronic acid biosynthesis glycosyltransferase TuaG
VNEDGPERDVSRRPLVSVVVPMYQSGWCVEETLDSIRSQTLAEFEAIIVNDGSTDDGPEVARRFAGADARFRLIDQENRGLAGARNTGTDAARGEYLYFLDADDRVMPWGLEAMVAAARRLGSAAVFGRVEWRDEVGHPTGWAPMLDHTEVGLDALLRGCVFPVNAQLVRREAVGSIRFEAGLRIGEDWDFWLRLAASGVVWRGIDRVVSGYRMSPGSLSRDAGAMWRSLKDTISAAHSRRGVPNRSVTEALALEWATASAMAGGARMESGIQEGIGLLRGEGVRTVCPSAAATKVFHRASWCLSMPPSRWADALAVPLRMAMAWWDGIEASGLGASGFSMEALRALSRLAATPERVAGSIADACQRAGEAGGRVQLIGLGRNARYVAAELARRGVGIDGWDDASETVPGWAADLGVDITMVRPQATEGDEAGSAWSGSVLTMTDDRAAMGRWGGLQPQRWSEHHARLADGVLGKFKRLITASGDNRCGREVGPALEKAAGAKSR